VVVQVVPVVQRDSDGRGADARLDSTVNLDARGLQIRLVRGNRTGTSIATLRLSVGSPEG